MTTGCLMQVIRLAGPLFPMPVPARPPGPAAQMRKWSVADVAAFYESHDAAALGQVLAANSVCGADLLKLSEADFTESLRMSPFAAHKVFQLRVQFLRS